MVDIYAILRTSCNGRVMNCTNPRNPESCTPCPDGICTSAPCTDFDNPLSCGSRYCASDAQSLTAYDDLRWSPILPMHIDGLDDPEDPLDDDVAPNTVSLVDGARRYLGQKYGADSEQFEQFEALGEGHGVTPNLDP